MFLMMKNKKLRLLFILFLNQILICQGQNYKGFNFEDNLLEERFGPDNGYGVYQLDTPIPNLVNLSFFYSFENIILTYLGIYMLQDLC